MKFVIACCLLSIAVLLAEARVFNSNYRDINRYNPLRSSVLPGRSKLPGNRYFTLTRRPGASLRPRHPSRRHRGSTSVSGRQNPITRRHGNAELKAREGSIDFGDEANAIIPNRRPVKPTKGPRPVIVREENKIQIETQINTGKESIVQQERVTVGSTAILHCTFDTSGMIGAYKQSQIWWTKLPQQSYDRPIILSAGNQIRLPDDRLKVITYPDNGYSILIISDTIEEDAGDYKCSLPTISGTKTAFSSLAVGDSVDYQIAISPKVSTVEVGGQLNLFCRPSDSRLNVWWTAKNEQGVNIDIDGGSERAMGSTLTVDDMSRRDSGVYTCHVENPTGSPIRRHFTVNVKETAWEITAYRNGFNIDTFLSKFNEDPQYGSSVNLRCDSGGVPVPEIKWFKSGKLLSNGQKYLINDYEPTYKENAITGKMTITNFQPSDEGSYTCVAANDSGRSEKEFTLQGYYDRIYIEDDDEENQQEAVYDTRHRNRIVIDEGSGDFLL